MCPRFAHSLPLLLLLGLCAHAHAQVWPNDPLLPLQWHHARPAGNTGSDLDSEWAWATTTGGLSPAGDTIVVAVIDAGVDHLHPDLRRNLWHNWAEVPDDGIDNDGNGYIDDARGWNVLKNNDDIGGLSAAHGTPLCGIIGAGGHNGTGTTGINWQVKIMFVATGGTIAELLEAYAYVLQARRRYNTSGGKEGAFVVAINNSFGTDFGQPAQAPLWCAQFDSLGAAGILSIAATANLPINVDLAGDLPTTCPSDYLISVTNLDSSDHKAAQAAWGAQHIDLGAYGQDILSTAALSSYGYFKGTSFAAPMVAGAVALLYAAPCPVLAAVAHAQPAEAALWVKKQVLGSTLPSPSLQGITQSGGRLNLAALIRAYQDDCPPCLPPFALAQHTTDNGLAYLAWRHMPEQQLFNLRWRKAGSEEWQEQWGISAYFPLPALPPCTEYECQVQAHCGPQDISDWSWPLRFWTAGCCQAPTALQASSPAPDTVVLSWAAQPQAQGYRLRVRPAGTAEWWMIEAPSASCTLGALKSCTRYEASVQTLCAAAPHTDFGPPTLFTTKGCEACLQMPYCAAKADQSSKEWIQQVQIGTWAHDSGTGGSGYQNFSGSLLKNPVLIGGVAQPITLTPGFLGQSFKENFRVYVDFNADGDFEDEAELAFDPGFAHNGPMSGLLYAPSLPYSLDTRMRVMMKFDPAAAAPPLPCEAFGYGQVEDYCIHIQPAATNPVAYLEGKKKYPARLPPARRPASAPRLAR
ncbi:MAG TPA: S8 family serine peptidase [Saprospiraceae bacterium]|nr:S8 family serine peptidase [Saprospiraceae bacterium]